LLIFEKFEKIVSDRLLFVAMHLIYKYPDESTW